LQFGDFSKDSAWLRLHALGMLQVARVVVRDLQGNWMAWSPRLQPCQDFRNVATLGGECLPPLAILRIVAQQIAIVFQARSAASSIAHHGIHLRAFECVNSAPCVIERCLLFSSVDHKRAAAALIPGNDHLATFCGEYASGGGVYFGEEDALHTSQ